MDDKGSIGEDGVGDEETNATFLEGDVLAPLLPLPEPLLGVLTGERRHDLVGEIRGCICIDTKRTVSVHFKVLLSILRFSFSSSDVGGRAESS